MAILDQIELPNGITYDIQDNQPAVLDIPNTPAQIATFSGAADLPMASLKVAVTPYQDLHGQDAPWAGGAGKNKLPLIISDIKSLNTSGTWNGNTYTINNVAFTIQTDDGGNVIGIATNGIANSEARIVVCDKTLNLGSSEYYTLSGCPSGGGDSTYNVGCWRAGSGSITEIGNGQTFSYSKPIRFVVSVNIKNGTNSANKLFQPMIESGSTKTSFAPYSNICPIIGWDEAVVNVSPLNIASLYNGQIYGDGLWVSSDKRLTNTSSAQDNSYFLKAGTYTLDYDKLNSNAPSLLQCSALTKDDNYTIIDNFANAWNILPFTFTLTQDGYLYFTIRKDANTTLNVDDYKVKVVKNTYTIDLNGTRYGSELDVLNGVDTDTLGSVDLGTLSWSYNNVQNFFSANLNDIKLTTTNLICDRYIYVEKPWVTMQNGEFGKVENSNQIRFHNDNYKTSADFKTAMSGVQFVYELATPITVQLAPTPVKSLEGENNISANCGQITEGKYVVSKYDGITAKISEVAHFAKTANKQVPEIHRKYESTSYYATTASQADSTWYFMSVKPDNWYKPWKVKFKVHTYCPNYPSYESITWSTFTGREQSLSYANFNERYDSAHYYISSATLKKAGFDAGYGHALGVSILYGGGYTTAAYYRTFEVDYYECENCTVTILDNPTKLASWNGYSSTNYNSVANYDAINRGLRETSDDNDGHYYSRRIYSNIKAGSNKIFPYTIIMQNADGRWESLVTSNSTGTSKTRNTHGFRLNQILYMSANATYNENAIVGTYAVNEFFGNLLDHRYSFNTANDSTNGTTANTPIYLVGSINATDGLFYLDTKWWTQTLPTSDDGKLYIYIGDAYDYYRMICSSNHPIYWYKEGKLQEYSQSSNYAVSAGSASTATTATSATTASKLGSSNVGSATQPIYLSAGTATACTYTLGKSVPSDAVFTDTKNTAGSTDTSSKIYLVGATSQAANPQTYSDNEIYTTSGVLTTKSVQVGGGAATMEYDATTQSINFIFN